MSAELAKQYDAHQAQRECLARWSQLGIGHSEPNDQPAYSIVIPPPNVTGALHMGHALNNTLQDVLIRYHRMIGRNALWMPGTDHAGIATQAVVERRILADEKKTRHDLGRDELVRRIWEWKDQYECRILGQLRSLGASADWQRTRFTLDPLCARAVREAFFRMFRTGYLSRGKRLVNWDTHLQTSVADDETYDETIKGGFWTFRYPVKDRPGEFIRFSTTRPETMLGDTAVAVHPDDPRYQHLIGARVTVPLVGREIPIIADGELVDPALGTGCVKVTPAHDRFDYECGQRHRLPMINILHSNGTINQNGGKYADLDRYKAREQVIADMEALGLFDGKEDRDIPMKFSDRSKTPIEPFLSDQWFVLMGDRPDGQPGLAQLAMDAVTSGCVKFFPERYAKTYLDWLGEKRDWCVSRQLWWGHRIPVWYARCAAADLERAFAGRTDVTWTRDEANDQWLICALTDLPADVLGADLPLVQDADVLDTWFSSALWPISTFGWPDSTPELRYYYPTSTLVTSRDIITLWVARMVLMGELFMHQVPFHEVYITPKVLDGFGDGMSKTKGNGVDPLDIIERYGADALRFEMVALAGETQDSRMPVANVCPHCDTLVPVKQEHLRMRTRKVKCPKCNNEFRPGGPWPSEDPALKTAKQASDRFETGRNFANKLWNATRFLLQNLDRYTPGPVTWAELPVEDRWIISRLATTAQDIRAQLQQYRFSEYARTIYDFTWSEFCDWYVEMAKGRLKDPAGRAVAQRVLIGVLDGIIRMVQPIMPFLADTLWQALQAAAPTRGLPTPTTPGACAVLTDWPSLPAEWCDAGTEARIGRLQDLVRIVREVRNRYTLDARTPLDVVVPCVAPIAAEFTNLLPFLQLLAGVGQLSAGPNVTKPPRATGQVRPDFAAYVSLAGLIDVAAEKTRLDKQLAEKRKAHQGAVSKLSNQNFVASAPADVVQLHRDKLAELEQQIAALESNLREFDAG
jgi:valyl-tRNA synthetase